MHTMIFTPLNFTYLNLGTGVTGIIVGGRPAPAGGDLSAPPQTSSFGWGDLSPHTAR